MLINELKSFLAGATAELSKEQRVLYCIYCTEKIIDLYRPVVDKYHFGDFQLVRKMADDVWNSLLNYSTFSGQLRRHWVPDGDDYPGMESALAMNVCICLDAAIDDHSDAHNAGIYVYDTICQIVFSKRPDQRELSASFLQEVDQLPVVQNEIADQRRVIAMIKSSLPDPVLIAKLREQAVIKRYTLENIAI
jgi:uncharacterized protein YjaG (DUF416 family)